MKQKKRSLEAFEIWCWGRMEKITELKELQMRMY